MGAAGGMCGGCSREVCGVGAARRYMRWVLKGSYVGVCCQEVSVVLSGLCCRRSQKVCKWMLPRGTCGGFC